MHIQASKNSRTAQRGRLFIIALFVLFISIIGVNVRESALPVHHHFSTLQASAQSSNGWSSFGDTLSLGIQRARQGTYHLLFLFTMLLPAMLVISRKKQWSGFGGVGYSLVRIFKIAGAFCIGHSITLLTGALGLIHFPIRVAEMLMTLGIVLAAINACKPIFGGREAYVAAGFGLVHGMAFAQTLLNLNPEAGRMPPGILAFNLGIELMLGFTIAMVIPWLIILSRINLYSGLRIACAALAAVAAMGWLIEQVSNQPNFVGAMVIAVSCHQQWLVLLLAMCAILSFCMKVASSTAASGYSK